MKRGINMAKKSENKTAKKPTCFIIMPITTPDHCVDIYRDRDHFVHTLKYLFVPAVEEAGFKPIEPIAEGATVIHQEIINNLVTADMLLCDMTILNANVFFELGVRVSLNKPTCLVRDDHTQRIPFDLLGINCHQYDSSLQAFLMKEEIAKIAEHIKITHKRSCGKNDMWQTFGIQVATAKLPESGDLSQDMLKLILGKLDGIGAKVPNVTFEPDASSGMREFISQVAQAYDVKIMDMDISDNYIDIQVDEVISTGKGFNMFFKVVLSWLKKRHPYIGVGTTDVFGVRMHDYRPERSKRSHSPRTG